MLCINVYRLAICNLWIMDGENLEQIIHLKTRHEVTQKSKIKNLVNKYIPLKKIYKYIDMNNKL